MTEPTTSAPSTPTQLEPERFAELATAIERAVGTFIVGQEQLVRQTLISLLAGRTRCSRACPGSARRCWCARWPRRWTSASAASSSRPT